MERVVLLTNARGYQGRILKDLICCGWKLESVPQDCVIPRNGMNLELIANDSEIKLRIFAYKVTTSGRSRLHERRVEITTTYKSGLHKVRGCGDVVIGIDTDGDRYVGIDSRRLLLGGETHNASSFFDLEGLSVEPGQILINPRSVAADIFKEGVEQHAFFDRTRISEYLFNHREIHAGSYAQGGAFQGMMPIKNKELPTHIERSKSFGQSFVLTAPKTSRHRAPVGKVFLEAMESNDFSRLKGRTITPEKLREIQAACEEIGALGEQAVLTQERSRLRKLGHSLAANRVERVSLRSVGEGYDVLSFEDDGTTPRYIEVKATVGKGFVVDISLGEWKAAMKHRERFYLVRVLNVREKPKLYYFRDPFQLDKEGRVTKITAGWRLDLTMAI